MTDGLGPDYPWRAIRKTAMEKDPEGDIGKAMTRYLKAEERIRELEAHTKALHGQVVGRFGRRDSWTLCTLCNGYKFPEAREREAE